MRSFIGTGSLAPPIFTFAVRNPVQNAISPDAADCST